MNSSTQKLTAYTAIGLIVLIIAAIVYVQFGSGQSSEVSANGNLDLSNQPSLGQEGAPVQIALFEDFKCPACGSFTQSVFPQIERQLVDSGQAEVFFVNFPFLGPDSTTAAIATECVYEQDEAAFWDYKKFIFRSQGPESQEWATPELLTSLARQNLPSVDADELRTCIDERRYADRVEAESRMGSAAGVNSTPSVYVNGEKVERPDFNSVSAAVQSALGQTN